MVNYYVKNADEGAKNVNSVSGRPNSAGQHEKSASLWNFKWLAIDIIVIRVWLISVKNLLTINVK